MENPNAPIEEGKMAVIHIFEVQIQEALSIGGGRLGKGFILQYVLIPRLSPIISENQGLSYYTYRVIDVMHFLYDRRRWNETDSRFYTD